VTQSRNDYRPRYVDEARGIVTVAEPWAQVGSLARPANPVPPSPWAGRWQPPEGELVRWGGATTIQPNPIAPAPGVQVLNATFPVPLITFVTLNVRVMGAGLWVTPLEAVIQWGVGQASTELVVPVTPGTPFQQLGPIGMRQTAITFRRPVPTVGNEPVLEAFASVVPFA
jgi:hypothetical protein